MNLGVGAISAPSGVSFSGPTALDSHSHLVHPESKGLTPATYFKRRVNLKSLHSVKMRWDLWDYRIPAPRRGAKGLGARFEKKALTRISPHMPVSTLERLLPGPILDFVQGNKTQRAIPDALLWSEDFNSICIIECKLRHNADAFYQIQGFYLPLVSRIFPSFRVSTLELCKFYDPSVRLPRPVAFISSLDEAFTIRECYHPVLIYTY